MAIPWLIGGAVAAAVAAAVAIASDDESSSSSSNSSLRDEERRLEKERERKKEQIKKEEFQSYARLTTKNLAKKYGGSNAGPLEKKLDALFKISRINHEIQRDVSLLALTAEFERKRNKVKDVQCQLDQLESAMSWLEGLDDEFK